MKYKKGISIISLIVAVAIMAILLGAVVFHVYEIGDQATAMKFLSEMSMVETKVMIEQQNAGNQLSYSFVGTRLFETDPIKVGNEFFPRANQIWYVLDENDLQRLGLTDIRGKYVVNYSTGEVYSVEGIKITGKRYYNSNDVAKAIDFE